MKQIAQEENRIVSDKENDSEKTETSSKGHSYRLRTPQFYTLKRKVQTMDRKMKSMRQTNQLFIKQVQDKQESQSLPALFKKKVAHSYADILGSYNKFFESMEHKEIKKRIKGAVKKAIFGKDSSTSAPPKLVTCSQMVVPVISFERMSVQNDDQVQFDYVQALWTGKSIVTCMKPTRVQPKKILSMQHKNFIEIYGFTELYNKNYAVVSEQANWSLKRLIQQFGLLNQQLAISYIKHVIEALMQLHLVKLYHNNITVDNVFHDRLGKAMLDTSGIEKPSSKSITEILQEEAASFRHEESTNDTEKFNTEDTKKPRQRHVFEDVDTLGMFINYYHPPQSLMPCQEVQKGDLSNTQKDQQVERGMKKDIWQIGCLALELILGPIDKGNKYHPYNYTESEFNKKKVPHNFRQLIQLINCEFEPIDQSFESTIEKQDIRLSSQFEQLVSKCLTISSEDRPTIWELSELTLFK